MWPTYTTLQLIARLTALNVQAYPGTPDFTSVKLFKNDINPDANSITSQFEEADFVGYVDVNCVMGAVSLDATNSPVSQSNLCHFQPTDDVNPNTIYGVFVVTAAGVLIAAQRFDAPIQMNNAFAAINGVWRTSEPLSNYGWLSVE
jgi:hypothetical protein